MASLSTTAMVLAAGYGMRMRPLTLQTPKPLLEVGGRTMLDLALDKLRDAGIQRAVVNAFYLGDQIERHLATRKDMDIIVLREDELLDTGGGIKNALSHLGDQPFFALNADLPWIDGPQPALVRMAVAWNPAMMDAQLLLMPTVKARGFGTRGDYRMDDNGRVHRHNERPPYPYVMLSAQIVKPEFFARRNDKIFSNNVVWDEVESQGRLYGIAHDGTCFHVGTPEDWQEANARLTDGRGWGVP